MKRFLMVAVLAALAVSTWASPAEAFGKRKKKQAAPACCEAPAPTCCDAPPAAPACCGATDAVPAAPADAAPPKTMPEVKPAPVKPAPVKPVVEPQKS